MGQKWGRLQNFDHFELCPVFFFLAFGHMEIDLPGYVAVFMPNAPGDSFQGDPGFRHEGNMGMAHYVRGDSASEDPLGCFTEIFIVGGIFQVFPIYAAHEQNQSGTHTSSFRLGYNAGSHGRAFQAPAAYRSHDWSITFLAEWRSY